MDEVNRRMALLERLKAEWALSDDGEVFVVGNSLLQPVISAGRKAMLKVPLKNEERRGFRLLSCWNGSAAVNVYRYNEHALLMERAMGDRSLKRMVLSGKEDEANRIICAVVEQLHANTCPLLGELAPLPVWFSSLAGAAAREGGFFAQSYATAQELLAAPAGVVALHGDIHYENILDAGPRGWLAIDPKGLAGERGFDYANIFCNPDITVAGSPDRLSRQVGLVAGFAGMEARRLLSWIIAWAGLSASWMLEDGEDPALPLRVGRLAMKELGEATG
ncbi:MAG TPA: aminoglycoside phosphotransferase family protein [Puia sp.]|jgi:streptomycin 6-kinase|nr:aminoglycoside phosphotransferase family protein [Puia sp.]